MKNLFPIAFLLLTLSFSFISCGGVEGKKVEAQEEKEVVEQEPTTLTKEHAVIVEDSKINWRGSKVVNGEHSGVVMIKEGKLLVENNELKGGTFVIDMNTIAATDMDEKQNNKLTSHLKDPDFFNTEGFPAAQFEITQVIPVTDVENATHKIEGNLEVLGIKKSITFEANVNVNDEGVTASTDQFVINRSEWGMNYKGNKDNMINDGIGITINLNAKKI